MGWPGSKIWQKIFIFFLIVQVRVLGGGYAYVNVLMEHLYNPSNVMITKYTMIFKCKIFVHYIKYSVILGIFLCIILNIAEKLLADH